MKKEEIIQLELITADLMANYLADDECPDFYENYSKDEAIKQVESFFKDNGLGCHIYMSVLFVQLKSKSEMIKEVSSNY